MTKVTSNKITQKIKTLSDVLQWWTIKLNLKDGSRDFMLLCRFFLEARKSKLQKFCFLNIISIQVILYKNWYLSFSWRYGYFAFLKYIFKFPATFLSLKYMEKFKNWFKKSHFKSNFFLTMVLD